MSKGYRKGTNIEYVWCRVYHLSIGDNVTISLSEINDKGMSLSTTRMSLNKISQDHGFVFMTRFADDSLKIMRIK